MTQHEKLINFFNSGKEITHKQAAGLFGVTNLSARVGELRARGYSIYTNKTKNGKVAFRLGTPSKRMVAMAYLIGGTRAFA
ncbi:MAG: hypothetical protein EB078_07450 [Proteobacteria bacterium]|jgi:hypothetical protein|nr:hypothetical protein [Pseudomonadota bacterium]NDD04725.1 hypothetical protein [Pseudomonadota bacterium]